jgi:hypothetical protein
MGRQGEADDKRGRYSPHSVDVGQVLGRRLPSNVISRRLVAARPKKAKILILNERVYGYRNPLVRGFYDGCVVTGSNEYSRGAQPGKNPFEEGSLFEVGNEQFLIHSSPIVI